MTAMELVSYLLPLSTNASPENESPTRRGSFMEQFLVIDLRAASDIELSGGGIIPRAVHIEPDFLSSPDALERWIEHFDGTRGCNICILDLPPVQATSGTLWYVS